MDSTVRFCWLGALQPPFLHMVCLSHMIMFFTELVMANYIQWCQLVPPMQLLQA